MGLKTQSIQVGPLRENELEEAGRIVCLAFGTFLGVPNPLEFMGDRDFVSPRWRARNTTVLAAREGGKLIGLNVATRWDRLRSSGRSPSCRITGTAAWRNNC